jgi:hypothetical protein
MSVNFGLMLVGPVQAPSGFTYNSSSDTSSTQTSSAGSTGEAVGWGGTQAGDDAEPGGATEADEDGEVGGVAEPGGDVQAGLRATAEKRPSRTHVRWSRTEGSPR